jgi:hypothetical protein
MSTKMNSARRRRYWVFQYRERDDISAVRQGGEYPWQTHGKVHPADGVILWKPGGDAGAFGFGTVLAAPVKKPFFGKPVSLRFRVTARFDHTLPKADLQKDRVLRTLQVVLGKGFGAGILPAAHAHFRQIEKSWQMVKSTSYWIFQANPRTGDDLRDLVLIRPKSDWWRLTRFKDPTENVRRGDKVALWQVEANEPAAAGIYAIGEITKPPIRKRGEWQGWFKFTGIRDAASPISANVLRADPVLRRVPAFGRKAAQGSNFRINRDQWERIVSYFSNGDDPQANGSNGKTPVVVTPIHGRNKFMEMAFVPDIPAHDVELRERGLVTSYRDHIRRKGLKSQQYAIRFPDGDVIVCDLYDPRRRVLVEAKSFAWRDDVRMAIGQLADYARFLNPRTLAVLLPNRPKPDLEKLLRSRQINTIWKTPDGGFLDNSKNGRLS